MSVRRAREEIDSEEFANWMAYFEEETWDFAGYHQIGTICASVANMFGNKDAVAADFMPLKKKRKGLKVVDAQQKLANMFGAK